MRSRRGLAAALAFLVALPLALLAAAFGADPELVLHAVWAVGFGLLALAVFDFRTPAWTNAVGALAAAALAGIFGLQAVSLLLQHAALTRFAFQVLGQQIESILIDILIVWFIYLFIYDSKGFVKYIGIITMLIIGIYEIYRYTVMYILADLHIEPLDFKILLLLPFVWLLLESARRDALGAVRRSAPLA